MSLAVSTFPQTSVGINNHSWLPIRSGYKNAMNGHGKSTTLFPMRVKEFSAPLEKDGVSNGRNPTFSSNKTNSDHSKNKQHSKQIPSIRTLAWDKNKGSMSGIHKEGYFHKKEQNLDSSGHDPSSTSTKTNENGEKVSNGRIPRYVKCFTCERIIKEDHFSEHLLFGSAKCSLCNSLFTGCQSFQIWATEYALGNVMCNHKFYYVGDPIKYLRKKISATPLESPIEDEKLFVLIKNYINKLKSLEERPPWKEAIVSCRNFVEPHKSSFLKTTDSNDKDRFGITKRKELNSSSATYSEDDNREDSTNIEEECLDNFQDYDIEQLERATEFVKVPEPLPTSESLYPKVASKKESGAKKRRAKGENLGSRKRSSTDGESMEYVAIPSDGFYYVSTKPIEECPNCYEMLCPSRFTVNVATFLMTVICESCDLTIYITSPEVQIVTENSNDTVTLMAGKGEYESNVMNEKRKRGPGRPRKSGKSFIKK